MPACAYDVVVVGGGHAGCEAAAAAARMGCRVALVTLDWSTVGEMPCNPAVGGVGKGHLVAEVDALGGLQGWAADRAGIQFRVLNRSRGPAVWGPRAQCDKARYRWVMQRALRGLERVDVLTGEVRGLRVSERAVEGVALADGRVVSGRAVVLTTGTFLEGVLHAGERRWRGGRLGEAASLGLGQSLRQLGVGLRRFKTGTPPRVHRDSVDVARLEEQHGDADPQPFSWRSRSVRNQVCCWVGRTPAVVRQIVQDNLERSPLFSGRIRGTGPRYCPSIEDKVVRFPHHEEHTVFVEPEGLGSPSLYLNGLSTSLPEDVQEAVVRAVPGLERAVLLRYGYAVEYDALAPGQVDHTLAVKDLPGLWVAGQVLGTSGYEEAAAQGLVAGVNAAAAVLGVEGLEVAREEGYLGVLVDDLVCCPHHEPYRMLTSRAEHRLVLGVDSARERLMARGVRLGLVPARVFHVEQGRWARQEKARLMLERTPLVPDAATRAWVRELAGVELQAPCTVAQLLRRQDVEVAEVADGLTGLADLDRVERRVVVGRLRYAGYVDRHRREQARVARLRSVQIPADLDFSTIGGLSREVLEALARQRPRTLAEAERMPGVTPAAVALLAGRLAGAGAGSGHGHG